MTRKEDNSAIILILKEKHKIRIKPIKKLYV